MKKVLKFLSNYIKKLFSDIHSAIVGIFVTAVFLSIIGSIYLFFKNIWLYLKQFLGNSLNINNTIIIFFILFLLSFIIVSIKLFKMNKFLKKNINTNSNLQIISPAESEVNEEWIKVSGIGAPQNYKILLFTWLKKKSSLQKDISTSDSNGNWYNQRCQLLNIGSYREIYAIALEPDKIDQALQLYEVFGKNLNPKIFSLMLSGNKIRCVVSLGKKLIRTTK